LFPNLELYDAGLITYLKEETQNKLNTYYFYATLHNKRTYDLAGIYNDKASLTEFRIEDIERLTETLAWQLNERELTKYEEDMKELIPKVKRLLDDEIKNAD
jgi:DUF1680 family protein